MNQQISKEDSLDYRTSSEIKSRNCRKDLYKQFKHWKNHKIGFELTYLAINKEGWLKNNKYKIR